MPSLLLCGAELSFTGRDAVFDDFGTSLTVVLPLQIYSRHLSLSSYNRFRALGYLAT